MSLLIKNGEIVTSADRYKADILVEGERIKAIEKDMQVPPNAKVIDAKGKFVFPGFIDPHTHIYLPFMGTTAKDTYESASKAALMGGTTTLIDFVIPGKKEEPLKALETWKQQSEGKSSCDYTFHMAVTRFDSEAESQIREIVAGGIPSFKVFLAYKGALGVEDKELYHTLRLAKELGVITMAHCENEVLVDELQQKLLKEGKTGPKWHYHSRPPVVEQEGTHHLMSFAKVHKAHVYVAHLSCDEALRVVMDAKHHGTDVWAETLIQFLLLDKSHAEQKDFVGSKYVMSPPLREKHNQQKLWDGLNQRIISTVATDHAPFDFKTQKTMGKDDFTRIPNGIPALEDRVNLLWSQGVSKGKVDIHRFVDMASTQAAKIFGLYPQKGTIAVGADADLVIYDPNHKGVISLENQSSSVDYCAFEGWEMSGRPDTVTVRGKVVVENAKFVGRKGHGKFIKRDPNHF